MGQRKREKMLGNVWEKKRDRKVLTKSRTSPEPSEERRVSLGEFGETKDFGTGIKADQRSWVKCPFLRLKSLWWGWSFSYKYTYATKKWSVVMPKVRGCLKTVACRIHYFTEFNNMGNVLFWQCTASSSKTKVGRFRVDTEIPRRLAKRRLSGDVVFKNCPRVIAQTIKNIDKNQSSEIRVVKTYLLCWGRSPQTPQSYWPGQNKKKDKITKLLSVKNSL